MAADCSAEAVRMEDEDGCAQEPHSEAHRTRSSVNMIQVAKLLTRTEECLVDTERELIEAVRRTIHVTEGMIALVRSTTATTQALMKPVRDLPKGGFGASCAKCSLHCVCSRFAMAKDLVRMVEGLNHTAGSLNEATDFLIKLSNSLCPREDLAASCVHYLTTRVASAEDAVRHIALVQSRLRMRAQALRAAADSLSAATEAAGEEALPERDQAVKDLTAMVEVAETAVKELSGTAGTLRGTAGFLEVVLRELEELDGMQACPEAGAALLEQLECPVCYQSSAPPALWACANGHVVCASCRAGVLSCPSCRGPLSARPAMLLTAWACSLRAWCPHRRAGCSAVLSIRDRAKHHEACEYRHAAQPPVAAAREDQDDGKAIPSADDDGPVSATPSLASLTADVPAERATEAATPADAAAAGHSPPRPASPPPAAPAGSVGHSRERLADGDRDADRDADPCLGPQRKRFRARHRMFPCCVM